MRNSLQRNEINGGAGEIRTRDKRFRKPLLYPSELQPHRHNGLAASRLAYGADLQSPRVGPARERE